MALVAGLRRDGAHGSPDAAPGGVEGDRQIAERRPDIRVIVLTTFDDDDRRPTPCGGAAGYLRRMCPDPSSALDELSASRPRSDLMSLGIG